MLLAADLADHMDNGFVNVQIGIDTVMLEHDDIGVLGGNDAGQPLQGTRHIWHNDGI